MHHQPHGEVQYIPPLQRIPPPPPSDSPPASPKSDTNHENPCTLAYGNSVAPACLPAASTFVAPFVTRAAMDLTVTTNGA